jgi:putative toxin-antitoxin system antitoxin component (TIGR02293 family)
MAPVKSAKRVSVTLTKSKTLTSKQLIHKYVDASNAVLTWAILGGQAFASAPPVTGYDFVQAGRDGVSRQSIDHLAGILNVPRKEMADLLHMSAKTLERKPARAVFNPIVSSLVIEISKTLAHGLSVFEDSDKLDRWLHKDNQALGGQTPYALLDTPTGINLVNRILNRLEEGVYT